MPRQLGARLLAHASTPVLALLALALGVLIARLPLAYSLAAFGAVALFAASVGEPALGLGLAIVFGPTKAFIAIARPDLPSDLGQIFFALAAAGWLARGLARREIVIPRLGLLLPLSLYLLVGLFSLLPASDLEEGLKEALKWVEIALGMVILLAEVERGRVGWIVAAILIAGLAQAAVGIWQFEFRSNCPEHFRILGDHCRAYGSFEQPNPYGGFLGLIWPVAAGLALGRLNASREGGRMRVKTLLASSFFLLAGGFILLGLYVSFSRGAWLGAAAAGLAMLIALPRRWAAGLALVSAVLAAGWGLSRAGLLPASLTVRLADMADFTLVSDVRGVNINDANFAIIERLAHWQAAVGMAQANPWLGVGWGNYAAAYPAFGLLNWENALGHAHMIYLNVLAETGALGLVTYVILWGAIFALTMRAVSKTMGASRGLAIGLLGAWAHLTAHQMVDDLYVNNIHFLLAALLALLIYLSRPKQEVSLD